MNDDKLVVGVFEDELDASLARMALQNEGIESFIADANTINTYSLYSNLLGGVKLMVRSSDFEQAKELLEKEPPSGIVEGEHFGDDKFQCPKCGSGDVEVPGVSKKWAYLSIILLGFPLLFTCRKYSCNSCGNIWEDK